MAESIIVSVDVEEQALNYIKSMEYWVCLYCNNLTPTATMSTGSFVEVTGGGYSRASLATANWTLESNVPRDIIAPLQSFVFTGILSSSPATIYGWFLKEKASGVLCPVAKKLDSPFEPLENGDTLKFTPKVQAGNGTPA